MASQEERTSWGAIAALAVGIFAMVAVEELPIGVLTMMSEDLGQSSGRVGLTVTAPGLAAAVSAVVMPVLVRQMDRRRVLVGLMVLMSVATAVSSAAPGLGVLVVVRCVVGVSIGGFWALAPAAAVRVAAAKDMGRATATVFSGGSTATVLGVPLATIAGALWGWRVSSLGIAVIALATAVWLWRALPPLPRESGAWTLRGLGKVARQPTIAASVVFTTMLVIAHFSAFTYASPLLQLRAGVSEAAVGGFLLLAGVGSVLGNFVVAWAMARLHTVGLVVAACWVSCVLACVAMLTTSPARGVAMMVLWGLAAAPVSSAVQLWLNRFAGDALEAATGLNTAAFNVGIACGSAVGGLVVDRWGVVAVPLAAAVLALCAVAPIVWVMRGGRAQAAPVSG